MTIVKPKNVPMDKRSDGVLRRPPGPSLPKLSWEETAREMAASHEDWLAWDTVVADGLDTVPWQCEKKSRSAERPAHGRIADR